MIYQLGHIIRRRFPFMWKSFGHLNSFLFHARYGKELSGVHSAIDSQASPFKVVPMRECPARDLAAFFASQPEAVFDYFKPHSFDEAALAELSADHSFIAYMLKDDDGYVGYFFLRSFFWGRGYLGKMVDFSHQGQGIGTLMCVLAMRIASTLGMRMFETISKDNPSSLRSSEKVLKTRIVKELPDNYLYIEDLGLK